MNSTHAQLKWEFKIDTLKYLENHFSSSHSSSFSSYKHHQNSQFNFNLRNIQDLDHLINRLNFVLYLNNRIFVNMSELSLFSLNNRNYLLKQKMNPFRNLSAISCLNMTHSDASNGFLSFEYNLTNLYPNTEYIFELNARWITNNHHNFVHESLPSAQIKIFTETNLNSDQEKCMLNVFSIFFRHMVQIDIFWTEKLYFQAF